MDKKYLEFWGNTFLEAARNQEMMEDLVRLSKEGFAAAEAQMALFRKFYGLDEPAKANFDGGEWQRKAYDEFKRSYKDFLQLLGVVPKEDYDELLSKYETLRRKFAERVSAGGAESPFGEDQGDLLDGIQDLIRTQTEQFQQLMKAFSPDAAKSRTTGKGKK